MYTVVNEGCVAGVPTPRARRAYEGYSRDGDFGGYR